MTKLLYRLFIKDGNDSDNPKTRAKYGTLSSIVGIITNIILSVIKLVAGILSASVAIMADAFNNLSDAGSSVITFISFKISSKPADRDHPFGHARMEYVSSMIVSFIILLVGAELLMSSGTKLINMGSAEPTLLDTVTFVILVCSIVLKLWLGFFNLTTSKKINSDVLRATAMDCFSDTLSTTAVLISSIIIKLTGWHFIDAIVGIGVSGLIIFAGAKILIDTKNALLGEAPVDGIVEDIKKIASEYPDILGIHDMMVHNYGPKTYIASFHAEVDGAADIFKLHDTIDNAERVVKERLGILCTIHMDPIVTNDETISELRSFVLEAINKTELKCSIHDFRAVLGETHTNLIFDIAVPFECKMNDKEIIDIVSSAISSQRNDHYCVITVDRE